jgi:hypothetical protein
VAEDEALACKNAEHCHAINSVSTSFMESTTAAGGLIRTEPGLTTSHRKFTREEQPGYQENYRY